MNIQIKNCQVARTTIQAPMIANDFSSNLASNENQYCQNAINYSNQEPVALTGWEKQKIEEAEHSLAQGKGVPFKEVKERILKSLEVDF